MKWINLFFVLLFVSYAEGLILTEVMYNPLDGNEWVEFYADNEINLSLVSFQDNYMEDEIVCCNETCSLFVEENKYFLLTDQDHTFNTSNLLFCVDDNALGNGLGNNGDTIIVRRNGTVINFTYNVSVPKGTSLSFVNGSWLVMEPSPWRKASSILIQQHSPTLKLSYLGPEIFFTGITYDSLFKVENTKYPGYNDKINVSFYFNLTLNKSLMKEARQKKSFKHYTTQLANFKVEEAGQYLVCGRILSATPKGNFENREKCVIVNVTDSKNIPCNVSLSLKIKKQIYNIGEKVIFENVLSNETLPYQIEYWVEDLFGNIVKSERVTTNTNQKRFTPTFEGGEKSYVIRSELREVFCNNTNNKTSDQRLISVRGKKKEESTIKIENVYSVTDGFEFGELIKIRLSLYKGNTTKNSVKAYVEGKNSRLSYTTYFNVYNKYTYHETTLPVQLKSECESSESEYFVIVEGFGRKAQKKISITHPETCDEKEEKKKKVKEISLLAYPNNLTGKNIVSVIRIYNNKDKEKNYSVWSYLYRGPKAYTGERRNNLLQVSVRNKTEKILVLQNKLSEYTEPGEYKLKIKILEADRKTPDEITREVSVKIPEKREFNESEIQETKSLNKATSNVLYESSSEKSKSYALPLLILTSALLLLGILKLKNTRN